MVFVQSLDKLPQVSRCVAFKVFALARQDFESECTSKVVFYYVPRSTSGACQDRFRGLRSPGL